MRDYPSWREGTLRHGRETGTMAQAARRQEGAPVSLVEHLECYLGEIEAGWDQDANGDEMPFQVARFPEGSGTDTISFATLGLSRHPLQSLSGKDINHELLMIVPDVLRDGPIPGLPQQVGNECPATDRPVLRGVVIGPRGTLVAGSEMKALYAATPVYFPDDFAVYDDQDQRIVIVWLVPISAREASYVRQHGWRAFEDRRTRPLPMGPVRSPSIARHPAGARCSSAAAARSSRLPLIRCCSLAR
jgi:hypothetical protein